MKYNLTLNLRAVLPASLGSITNVGILELCV